LSPKRPAGVYTFNDHMLTETEKRVALLVVEGYTNKAVAERLGVSKNTIDSHLRSIYVKLGVHTRLQLARRLDVAGLVVEMGWA
jgi:DNA-binding CsgD family transcriptional regulator